jgi:hypothetical protein
MMPDNENLLHLSADQLADLYHECTVGLNQQPNDREAERERLRALRRRIYERFRERKRAETSAHRHALVVGFVGRHNSGDEMMLEMHLQILRGLGFDDVDIWTDLTDDVADYYHPLYWTPRTPYELVVLGGGGLDIGFGFHQAFLAKLRFGAKVVLSSVNLPSDDERYLTTLETLCDLVITRNPLEYERLKQRLPGLRFLQDVSTLHCPRPAVRDRSRIAMVVRNEPETVLRFAPEEPFDVLVLSRNDRTISSGYARQFGGCLVPLWHRDPREHVDVLAGYSRVISAGRFHAALWGALHCEDYAFLFPAYYKRLSPAIRGISGRLSWRQIQVVAAHHTIETKVGLAADRLRAYGMATEEAYRSSIAGVLGKRPERPSSPAPGTN